MRKIIDKLNDLIAIDYDAVSAYEAAIRRIQAPIIRDRLREFQGDHERHISDLARFVRDFGGTPRERPDAKGFFLKAFTAVTSMMGDRAALSAMKTNEELTNRTYDRALEELWPASVQDVLVRNRDDERRHLSFIEQSIAEGQVARTEPIA